MLSGPPRGAAWCQPTAEEPQVGASDSYPLGGVALRFADDTTAKCCY